MKSIIFDKMNKDSDFHLTFKQMKSLVGAKNNPRKTELIELLQELEEDAQIYKDEHNFYTRFPSNFFVTEILPYENDHAYVMIDDKARRIGKLNLNGALNFDKVIVEIRDGIPYVVKVLNRPQNIIVCEVRQDISGRLYLESFGINNTIRVRIGHKDMKKLQLQDRVSVEVTSTKYGFEYDANLLHYLGNAKDENIDLMCIEYLKHVPTLENLSPSEQTKYQKVLAKKQDEIIEFLEVNKHKDNIIRATLIGYTSFSLKIRTDDGLIGTILFEDVLNDDLGVSRIERHLFSFNTFDDYLIGHSLLIRLKQASYIDNKVYFELIENETLTKEQELKRSLNAKHN